MSDNQTPSRHKIQVNIVSDGQWDFLIFSIINYNKERM